MRRPQRFLMAAILLSGIAVFGAEVPGYEARLKSAQDAESRGLLKQAIHLAGQAVEAAPEDPRGYRLRARLYQRTRQWSEANHDLSKVVELLPQEAGPFYERAMVRLYLADFAGAVADFDRLGALRPARSADLWQRGIALFFDRRFDEARRQFEEHRGVNPADVENSAWHFACVAKLEGSAAAREKWMPVNGDRRIPMSQIQALMWGKGTEADVESAVEAVSEVDQKAMAGFYRDLYLALYHGAEGNRDLEARHAAAAARSADAYGIMGAIARLYVDWLAAALIRASDGR